MTRGPIAEARFSSQTPKSLPETTMDLITTNAVISARIIELTMQGLSIKEAINAVLGPETYEKIASDIYDALRAGQ